MRVLRPAITISPMNNTLTLPEESLAQQGCDLAQTPARTHMTDYTKHERD